MWMALSKIQRIAVIAITPISIWTIHVLAGYTSFAHPIIEMGLDVFIFFFVPYVFARAAIPITAFAEWLFNLPS